jgi:hypothetical protein
VIRLELIQHPAERQTLPVLHLDPEAARIAIVSDDDAGSVGDNQLMPYRPALTLRFHVAAGSASG